MNSSPVVLLDAADRRPAKEAQEWFGDGLRLLRMRLAQWTLFSALAVLALFFAGLLGSSVVGAGGEKLVLATLPVRMLLVNVVVVAVQCGMYRAMTRVVQEGGSVRIDDMLWLFSAAQRRQLLMFAVLLTAFNVLFVLLEHWLLAGQALIVPDAQGEFLMGRERVSVNMEALVRYSVLWTVNTLLVWALTWAVLPLMTMFSSVSLRVALRYTLDGMVKNLGGLMLLGVFVSMLLMAAGMLIVLAGNVLPVLVLPLSALLVVWMLPLSNLWSYAAFRHIYTDW